MPTPQLPVRLAPGWCSVYGAASGWGILDKTRSSELQFGQVIQLPCNDDYAGTVSIDQSVMFRLDDAKVVQYSGYNYFLLPVDKIILIENILT